MELQLPLADKVHLHCGIEVDRDRTPRIKSPVAVSAPVPTQTKNAQQMLLNDSSPICLPDLPAPAKGAFRHKVSSRFAFTHRDGGHGFPPFPTRPRAPQRLGRE